MIASALRAEIVRSAVALRARHPLPAGPDARGRASSSASLPRLLDRLETGSRDEAVGLACRAFFQHVAAENGLGWLRSMQERCGIPTEALAFLGSGREECRNRAEEALDAIDALVEDPTQLPVLRAHLRDAIAHFDRLCEEVKHVGSVGNAHVSAA